MKILVTRMVTKIKMLWLLFPLPFLNNTFFTEIYGISAVFDRAAQNLFAQGTPLVEANSEGNSSHNMYIYGGWSPSGVEFVQKCMRNTWWPTAEIRFIIVAVKTRN